MTPQSPMTRIALREPSFRGHVLAEGFVADIATLGEHLARVRVLAVVAPGVTVARVDSLYVVRLPIPLRVDASTSPLTPLVRVGTVLSTTPLNASERREIGAVPIGGLVYARAGCATMVTPNAVAFVDLAEWIDVASFAVIAVTSLGAPPAQPREAIAPSAVSTREVFGAAVSLADPEAARVRAALLAGVRERADSSGHAQSIGGGSIAASVVAAGALLAALAFAPFVALGALGALVVASLFARSRRPKARARRGRARRARAWWHLLHRRAPPASGRTWSRG